MNYCYFFCNFAIKLLTAKVSHTKKKNEDNRLYKIFVSYNPRYRISILSGIARRKMPEGIS